MERNNKGEDEMKAVSTKFMRFKPLRKLVEEARLFRKYSFPATSLGRCEAKLRKKIAVRWGI